MPVTSDHPTPIGYSTPAATGIALTERPGALARRLPRYPVVPATLMRRPILDARHHGRAYGEFLPFDAFSRTLRSEIASYAFVVDAKADKPAEFYRRYGFLPLIEGGRRVFVPVAGIAKPFAE